jgi:two-component system phosphate regulon sensor histidine kinase PhoR
MFRSIRWRIAIPYVLLIAISMISLTAYLSRIVRDEYLAGVEAQLTSSARLIADAAQAGLAREERRATFDPLAHRYGALIGARVTIIGADGTVHGDSQEEVSRMDNHLDRPEVQEAIITGRGSATRQSATAGVSMTYVAVPVMQDDRLVGVARVALPLGRVQEQIARLRWSIVIAGLLAGLFAIVLGGLIAERTARPLRMLTEVAGRMARGDLSARLLPTTHDEIGELTNAVNNVAAQLRGEIHSLSAERSRLAAILANMADGVLITDPEGSVQLINPAAERLLNTPEAQALGRSYAQVMRHHQLIELWRRCRERDASQAEMVELDRRQVVVQAIVAPFPQEGSEGYLVILQDLSQVRRLETVRRDFISNISHELRTPLAGLRALTDTLREGALEDPPAARRFLDRMDVEVDAMTQMVQELLELARIESGKAPMRLTATPAAEMVLPAVERLQPQAERAGLTLTVDAPADLPAVLADGERMRQVVTNLVHNAIKFTLAGGQVEVRVARGEQEGAPAVIVSVRDTGVGISEVDLPRIFERFYKADRARSRGGTGLGLAIAKHIVQSHGGRIWAESVEGKGSTFSFSLPALTRV